MIQINLLPDVKREYLRSQQMKHMFVVGSVLITFLALSALILLFAYVQVVQPRHRANLQKDVDSGVTELKNKTDAIKIVTVQGVLEQIPALQDKKLITSNLFGYLGEFTPRDVSYSEVKLDLAANTMTLSGQTTSLERANVLANNLKSAKFAYKQKDSAATIQPFTSVVFASLGKAEKADSGKNVSFEITLSLNPIMFAQDVTDQQITVNASSEELLLPTAQPFSDSSSPGGTQ